MRHFSYILFYIVIFWSEGLMIYCEIFSWNIFIHCWRGTNYKKHWLSVFIENTWCHQGPITFGHMWKNWLQKFDHTFYLGLGYAVHLCHTQKITPQWVCLIEFWCMSLSIQSTFHIPNLQMFVHKRFYSGLEGSSLAFDFWNALLKQKITMCLVWQ